MLITTITLFVLAAQVAAPLRTQDAQPYVVQVDTLSEEGAKRAEAALRSMAGIDRIQADVAERTLQIWARKQDAAQHPVLLSTSKIQRELAQLGLKTDAITEPAWARMKVYIVEAAGGG